MFRKPARRADDMVPADHLATNGLWQGRATDRVIDERLETHRGT